MDCSFFATFLRDDGARFAAQSCTGDEERMSKERKKTYVRQWEEENAKGRGGETFFEAAEVPGYLL